MAEEFLEKGRLGVGRGRKSFGEVEAFPTVKQGPPFYIPILLQFSIHSMYRRFITSTITSFRQYQLSHLFIHSTLVSVSAAGFLFVAAEMEPTTPLRGGNRAARNRHDRFFFELHPPQGGVIPRENGRSNV